MAKHIVFYTVLLVLAAVLLIVHTVIMSRKKIALNAVLDATNFDDHRQCSTVVEKLSSAIGTCARADSDKVSKVVSTMMNTITAKKQRAAEKVCSMCETAPELCLLDTELAAFVKNNCISPSLGDLPEPDIPAVVVEPISPVPLPPPTFPKLEFVSSTDSTITLMWSPLDPSTIPILKMVSPSTVVVNNLTYTSRQFTWPSLQSPSTTSLQPDTKYTFTLGVRRGLDEYFSTETLEASTSRAVGVVPQATVDASALSEKSLTLSWKQPKKATSSVLLRFNPGVVLDESTTPIVVPNDTPGFQMSYEFDSLQPFSWYTWCIGIRDGQYDTWNNPETIRTLTPILAAPVLQSTSKGIDYVSLQWDAVDADVSARLFFAEGATMPVSVVEDDAQGIPVSTTQQTWTGLAPSTAYTAVIKVFKVFTDANEPVGSLFRTVVVSATSSITVTTENAVYIPQSAISATATDTTLTLYWNATIPVGYSPMVFFSVGSVLPMVPANKATMQYNLLDDSTSLRTASFVSEIIVEAGTWIAYNLEPSTTYAVGLALRKDNLVIVYNMKTMVVTTSSPPADLKFPVIQSIRAVSTQNSSVLQVLWKKPPLSLGGSIAASILRILPDPYRALNASLTNVGVVGVSNLNENRSSDLLAGSDLGGVDIAVDPQVPMYTISLNYFFTEEVAARSAISKPRSQRPVWWKLPSFANTLKIDSYSVAEGGKVAVAVSWTPIDLSRNTAMYGPVSAVMSVDTFEVPTALATRSAVFNVSPNMVHIFSVTYRNNRNVDSVSGSLTAFVDAIPPLVTLSVTALSTVAMVAWSQYDASLNTMTILIGQEGSSQGSSMEPSGASKLLSGLAPNSNYWIQAVTRSRNNQLTTSSPLVTFSTLPALSFTGVMTATPQANSASIDMAPALPSVNKAGVQVSATLQAAEAAYVVLFSTQKPSPYTVSGLSAGQKYTASLTCKYATTVAGQAVLDEGSGIQQAVDFMTPFAEPFVISAVSGPSSATISWPPAKTSGYRVFVQYKPETSTTWTTEEAVSSSGSYTFPMSSLEMYSVRAGRFVDTTLGAWSDVVGAAPNIPLKQTLALPTAASVSWTQSSVPANVAGVVIYYRMQNTDPWTKANGASFSYTEAVNARTVECYASCVSTSGLVSVGQTQNIAVPGQLNPVVKATTPVAADISWNAAALPAGFSMWAMMQVGRVNLTPSLGKSSLTVASSSTVTFTISYSLTGAAEDTQSFSLTATTPGVPVFSNLAQKKGTPNSATISFAVTELNWIIQTGNVANNMIYEITYNGITKSEMLNFWDSSNLAIDMSRNIFTTTPSPDNSQFTYRIGAMDVNGGVYWSGVNSAWFLGDITGRLSFFTQPGSGGYTSLMVKVSGYTLPPGFRWAVIVYSEYPSTALPLTESNSYKYWTPLDEASIAWIPPSVSGGNTTFGYNALRFSGYNSCPRGVDVFVGRGVSTAPAVRYGNHRVNFSWNHVRASVTCALDGPCVRSCNYMLTGAQIAADQRPFDSDYTKSQIDWAPFSKFSTSVPTGF